jgi:hypothetical protein
MEYSMAVDCNPRRVYDGDLLRAGALRLALRPIAAFRAARMDDR